MQHLTLEQCRKLKEIGFPQDTLLIWSISKSSGYSNNVTHIYRVAIERDVSGDSWIMVPQVRRGMTKTLNFVACPTLEELLEWLVPGPLELEYYSDHWHAIWTPYNTEETMHTTCADTPLIAVYNLAVALHSSPDTMGSHP